MSTNANSNRQNKRDQNGFSQKVLAPRAYVANLALAQISGHSNSQLRFRFQKYLVK